MNLDMPCWVQATDMSVKEKFYQIYNFSGMACQGKQWTKPMLATIAFPIIHSGIFLYQN